ncbi:MAG: GNAT family N-acetyltransferase [Acidimicrobiia bacterium]|nr:GNAT family N-acetyltransferase [Acidimicrobiia bacterium]
MSALTVSLVDPCRDHRWAELCSGPQASLFVAPPWLATLRDTYGFEPQAAIVCDAAGRARSGVPFVRLQSMRGPATVAAPFSDFCTPILGCSTDWAPLGDALTAQGAPVRVKTLRRPDRPEVDLDGRFTRAATAAWHLIGTDRTEDELWSALHGSARRNVRRARDAGVEVRAESGIEAVRAFYELHLGVRKHKYRLLPQPWRFFERVHEHFAPAGSLRVLLARLDGRPVAGIFLLRWNEVWYYKFNASSPDALTSRPNDLLMWEAMMFAATQGAAAIDLGLSDCDQPTLIRYKRKFATLEGAVQSWTAPAQRAGTDPASRLAPEEGCPPPPPAPAVLAEVLGTLTELCTRADVPDAVTEAAGAAAYRYFA